MLSTQRVWKEEKYLIKIELSFDKWWDLLILVTWLKKDGSRLDSGKD